MPARSTTQNVRVFARHELSAEELMTVDDLIRFAGRGAHR
jgi:hypothetical protein